MRRNCKPGWVQIKVCIPESIDAAIRLEKSRQEHVYQKRCSYATALVDMLVIQDSLPAGMSRRDGQPEAIPA